MHRCGQECCFQILASWISCFLDASKAFDLVKHRFTFCKVAGLPGVVVRVLASWYIRYSSQELRVRWGCAFSDPFGVSNGVRQGGVLSPVLFSVHLDLLVLRSLVLAVIGRVNLLVLSLMLMTLCC